MTLLAPCALLVLLLSVGGCSLCRVKAIEDCRQYEARYPVRIVTYEMNMAGKAYGAFFWNYHAQCMVWIDGKAYYIGEFGGLSERPTWGVKGNVVQWELETYQKAIGR